jgi:peptidoglycan/LPS O-acetylase OafA/YrhL
VPAPTSLPAPEGGRQIASLDGVRGIAILLVLCIHIQQTGVIPARFHLINTLLHAGWCGVDLFFVLSGFLITLGLLASKGAVNYFSAFYMRRVLRIFPLYYAVVVAAMICSAFVGAYSPNMTLVGDSTQGSIFPTQWGWISHLLYLQNWWMPWQEPESRSILGHFWSLAIEEQFYLVWPLCVWLLPVRRLLVGAIAVCVAALALRIGLALDHVSTQLIFRNTVTRSDTLLVGAICAMFVRDAALIARVRPVLPFLAALGSAYVVAVAVGIKDETAQAFYAVTFGFTALAVVFGALVIWAYVDRGRRNWSDRLLSIRPLTVLGKYSYGVYVYHIPVIYLAKMHFGDSAWFGHDLAPCSLFIAGALAATVAIAAISYEYFEKRFLRLKRFFTPVEGSGAERDVARARVETA